MLRSILELLVPLGKFEADRDQVDFIFFDEGDIQVHTIRVRRVTGFALRAPEGSWAAVSV